MASRLQDVIQRGLASARPVATTVAPGTLYFSTDTSVIERSSGSAWEAYSAVVVGGGSAGGADFTNAGHPQGVVTGVGGQTCRDTTTGILYIKRSLASSAYGWYPLFEYGGVMEAACPMQFSWHASPPGNSIAGDNLALTGNGINLSSSGTASQVPFRAADSYYNQFLTGTAAGNKAQVYDTNYTASRFQWSLYNFDIAFKIRLPSAIADQRIWIGLVSTDPANADTITGTCVCFRYSSVANAGQWDAVVRDGTTTNVLASIAAAAVDTAYLLRIRKVGGTVYFSIDNGAEVSTPTNVPTNTDNPFVNLMTFNVSGAGGTARSFYLSRIGCVFGS